QALLSQPPRPRPRHRAFPAFHRRGSEACRDAARHDFRAVPADQYSRYSGGIWEGGYRRSEHHADGSEGVFGAGLSVWGASTPAAMTPHPPFGHLLPQGEKGGIVPVPNSELPLSPRGRGWIGRRPRRVRGPTPPPAPPGKSPT